MLPARRRKSGAVTAGVAAVGRRGEPWPEGGSAVLAQGGRVDRTPLMGTDEDVVQ